MTPGRSKQHITRLVSLQLGSDQCKAHRPEPGLCRTPEFGTHIHPAGETRGRLFRTMLQTLL